jgi:hypothetical protein
MKLLSPLNLVRQALKIYEAPESVDLLDAAAKIGDLGDRAIPRDLLSLGVKMHLRGVLNTVAVQCNRDWVWPYWIERQFNPADKSFVPRSHALSHINLTHRNWTILGVLGNSHRCVVDPRSLVTPWPEGWSLDFWLVIGNQLHTPARRTKVKQGIHLRYPQVKTQFQVGGLLIKSRVFAADINNEGYVLQRVRLISQSPDDQSFKFCFSVRPYNPEGISLIRQLEFVQNHVWRVNHRTGVILAQAPERVFCSDLRQGDVSLFLHSRDTRKQVACPVGMATGLAEYAVTLAPQERREFLALMPLAPKKEAQISISDFASLDYEATGRRVKQAWKKMLSPGTELHFPNRKLNDSFLANRAYLHTFDRGQWMTPGVLTYGQCWIRDSAYMIHALDKLGFHQQAEEKLLYLPQRQTKDGYFSFQEGEWDANGLALWVIVEHYRLTGNRELLRHFYPALSRAANWIQRKRVETRPKVSPHYGLFPAGLSAEHLGPCDYYYWDNFWGLAGLQQAAFAARVVGREADAERFCGFASRYRHTIEKSLERSEKQAGFPFLPAAPYRRIDSGAIGSLCAVYPLRLLKPDDPRVLNTIKLLEERFLIGDGFFQDHFHSGVNCYLSAHLAQCYLANGNPRAWKIVRYLLKRASSTYTWPEAFHPITKGGCMGEGHHGWATADWTLLLRNLMFHEDDERLRLLPLLLPADLVQGHTFAAYKAPSCFGRVNFKLFVDKRDMQLELANDFHLAKPKSLVWRLPFKPSKVLVDGRLLPHASSDLNLDATVSKVMVTR